MKKLSQLKLFALLISTVLFSFHSFAETTNSGVPDEPFDLGGLVFSLENDTKKEVTSGVTDEAALKALEVESKTATALAATFPESNRVNAEKVFKLALYAHHKNEELLGIPKNDIYGAATAFLYGNWSSYHDGKTIEDKYLPTMVKEVKILLEPSFSKKFANASHAEKNAAYEKFAMIGNWMVIMQLQLKKHPNPDASAKLKKISEGFLKEVGVEASRFDISREGHIEISR